MPVRSAAARIQRGLRGTDRLHLSAGVLVTAAGLLTATTAPLALADGMEDLLSPLKRLRFPAHEVAMMMTIALRFIPTLGEEAEKISRAQAARGADEACLPLRFEVPKKSRT